MKKKRSLKVYGQSGYNYKNTPAIMLKGNWLAELGFSIGDYISVSCEDGKIIITPDAEKAALVAEENAYMEREIAKLHERFLLERKQLKDRFVAEAGARYGE